MTSKCTGFFFVDCDADNKSESNLAYKGDVVWLSLLFDSNFTLLLSIQGIALLHYTKVITITSKVLHYYNAYNLLHCTKVITLLHYVKGIALLHYTQVITLHKRYCVVTLHKRYSIITLH